MKKFILTLSMALLAAGLLQAAQVSESAARTIAAQFMLQRGMGNIAQAQPIKAPRSNATTAQAPAAYYVFNAQQAKGFVIVSGDDRTEQVLGYSDRGSFDPSTVPPGMQDMLDSYAEEISSLSSDYTPAQVAPKAEKAAVQPLTTSQWGQDAPFYFQCPKVNNDYCVTGCTATAMAQIMYYHKWPTSTSVAIPAYTSAAINQNLSQLPATSFDWSSMVNYYDSNETSTTNTANAAVAKLMRYCGQAVQMDYGVNGSSGHDGCEVFTDFFKFSTKARQMFRCDYNYTTWENAILNELNNKRPVLHAGFKHKGGHAFIVDGYDGKGYYHYNWGWYGSYDGYFLLSALYPQGGGTGSIQGNNGYNMHQRIIIGLQPNTTSTSEFNSVTECYSLSVEKTTYTRSSSSDAFTINVTANHYNHSPVARTYDLGWGVYTYDGYTQKQYYSNFTNQSFNAMEYKAFNRSINFGKDLPNGTYYLRPISKQSSNHTWFPSHYSGCNFIKAVINGNTLTLTVSKTGATNGVTASINSYGLIKKINRPLQVSLLVTNHIFNDDIPFYLWANNVLVGANSLYLPNGSSGAVSIEYIPTATGTNTLKVTADSKGENVYCTGSVNVEALSAAALTATYSVTGVYDGDKLSGTTFPLVVTIKNNKSTAYNDYILVNFYKQIGNTNNYSFLKSMMKGINLSGNASTTQYFTCPNLEPARYMAVIYYYDQNNTVQAVKTTSYQVVGSTGLRGDVNGDGAVNVSDVTTLVNMILGTETMNKTRADVDNDGSVNVSDVTALINLILGSH